VRVPEENLLGEVPDQGFAQLMDSLPQERLVIAVQAVASMVAALDETISYVKGRTAFNERIFDFQNTRFVLAECATATEVGKAFVERCMAQLVDGQLDPSLAAMAKLWTTEQQFHLVDRCLQLFGGYGYLSEYPISQMWADARVQRIFGGTSEIMKELIGRSL
jgi:alkylation response protein AidB-like acyl-CoA dehydrogenase